MGGLLGSIKDAGGGLTAIAGLSYGCGYLVLRGRAHALGTEPGFKLIDQAYVFAGFRFALLTLISLLITAPLVIGLHAVARCTTRILGTVAAKALNVAAAAILALATLGLFFATLRVSDALLTPPAPEALPRYLWNAVLGRNGFGLVSVLAGTALAECSLLWLRARHTWFDTRDALGMVIAVIASLQIVLLPLQFGVFYADHTARILEQAPSGVVGVLPPLWLVDRGPERAVLLTRDAAGCFDLITVKNEALDGIPVSGIAGLGDVVAASGNLQCHARHSAGSG
jgi:hypothetical protein